MLCLQNQCSLQSLLLPSMWSFQFWAENLERYLKTHRERVEHVFPKNLYQLPETVFDKLDSFYVLYTDNQILFNNFAVSDLRPLCAEDEHLKDTKIMTRIGRYIPFSVSIPSHLKKDAIFWWSLKPLDLASTFNDAVENLRLQIKAHVKGILFQKETTKNVIARIVEAPNQHRRHCIWFEAEDHNSEEGSTQFIQIQNKLINRLVETFCEILQNITSLRIQQSEVTYQHYQVLLTTYSCKWKRLWTDCYQRSQVFRFFQNW